MVVLKSQGGANHDAPPGQKTTPGVAHAQEYEVPMPARDRRRGDPDMTDARYPEKWLNDRRIRTLCSDAFRLFVTANAWSIANRTDGVITSADLPLIPDTNPTFVPDLVQVGLWGETRTGWLILDYADTQTTKAQLVHLEAIRQAEREKKARQRAQSPKSQGDVPRKVSGTSQIVSSLRDFDNDSGGDGR